MLAELAVIDARRHARENPTTYSEKDFSAEDLALYAAYAAIDGQQAPSLETP